MRLISKASIQIQRPPNVVFEGIVNPDQMCQYFIANSSGRMVSRTTVLWSFPEFSDQYPVDVKTIQKDESITFVWDPDTTVHIQLTPQDDGSTVVSINEDGKELNAANLEWHVQNTGGWANFLACLKAYLEYDINLRRGAFDFMRTSTVT